MKIFLFFLNFLLLSQSIYSETHYVGLGRDCQVACMLKVNKIRKEAFPLDWLVSKNFDKVCLAFEDDFINFLNPSYLEYKVNYIYNSHYEFAYNHFFPLKGKRATGEVCQAGVLDENFLDHLPIVESVQNRRINRLQTLLNSNDKVIFIRCHGKPEDATNFVYLIKNKYPNLDFLLVIIHENENYNFEWEIPNAINFYVTKKSGRGDWWHIDEWNHILEILKLNYSDLDSKPIEKLEN